MTLFCKIHEFGINIPNAGWWWGDRPVLGGEGCARKLSRQPRHRGSQGDADHLSWIRGRYLQVPLTGDLTIFEVLGWTWSCLFTVCHDEITLVTFSGTSTKIRSVYGIGYLVSGNRKRKIHLLRPQSYQAWFVNSHVLCSKLQIMILFFCEIYFPIRLISHTKVKP